MKTYKIEFNNFGVCYIIAESFKECERLFFQSGYGGKDVVVKSISNLSESNPPLYAV